MRLAAWIKFNLHQRKKPCQRKLCTLCRQQIDTSGFRTNELSGSPIRVPGFSTAPRRGRSDRGGAASKPGDAAHLGGRRQRLRAWPPVHLLLPPDQLARIKDPHFRTALRLQDAFGLRREEGIKFTPSYADRGSRIVLKASWTKGGGPREIPVLKDGQRQLLDEARALAGGGAMIPGRGNYAQQLEVYEGQTKEAGLVRNHGLRLAYAARRYEEITGWKPPVAGGPPMRSLKDTGRRTDRDARQTISREMGHVRRSVVMRLRS